MFHGDVVLYIFLNLTKKNSQVKFMNPKCFAYLILCNICNINILYSFNIYNINKTFHKDHSILYFHCHMKPLIHLVLAQNGIPTNLHFYNLEQVMLPLFFTWCWELGTYSILVFSKSLIILWIISYYFLFCFYCFFFETHLSL